LIRLLKIIKQHGGTDSTADRLITDLWCP